ncbi:hypothetical protein ACFU51_33345 [Streptomyces sp. NPDC057430]|uniref:hypothetical protein n=1 Tax=Streptomyces sp. NPDC057430 TaxID=3346131 RepID=UPI0036B72D9B
MTRFSSLGITVARNDYQAMAGNSDDFVQWGTVVECEAIAEAIAEATLGQVVEAVGTILETLWNRGYRAVAACDYEDELPRYGHG